MATDAPQAPPMLDEPKPLEEPALPLEEPELPSPATSAQPPQSPQGVSPQAAPQGAPGQTPDGDSPSFLHQAQQAVGALPDAVGAGLWKGVFETKDFLTGGETPENQRSGFRQRVDSQIEGEGTGGKLISGISQFAIGMLGAGKLAAVAKAAPLIGDTVAAAGDLLGGSVGSSTKAAVAASTAFDPHEGNLANMVQTVPGLSNPVTQYLSAQPGDSEALDRAKNAMLSIGLDAAATGVFTASVKVLKALKGGGEGLEAAHGELTDAVQAQQQQAQGVKPLEEPPVPAQGQPEAPAGGDNTSLQPSPATPEGAPSDVRMVNNATQGAGPEGLPARPALFAMGDDQLEALLSHAKADSDAIMQHGSWDNAIDAGHVFGDPQDKIPWQKFSSKPGDGGDTLDALIQRVADTFKPDIDAAKGGDVVTDAMNNSSVNARANLWNQDPQALLGMLQAAGKDATQMRANMDASFLVAQRVMQDTYALSARINAGDFTEFGGSREAAMAAFKQYSELAATAYAQGRSMGSNAGRTLRGMRGDYSPPASTLDAMRSADPEMLLQVLVGTKGDPRALTQALQPGLWEPGGFAYAAKKFGSWAQYLLINALTSNPVTHAVIGATNTYQVLSRPLERIIGGVAQRAMGVGDAGAAAATSQAGRLQYTYMRSVLGDSWDQAVKAFNSGDSVMAPHSTELSPAGGSTIGQDVAQAEFKPFDSVSNVLSNAVTAAQKAVGLPTRVIGWQDELVKQIVYRSKVLADAHVEGLNMGLEGDALNQHVQGQLASSFDTAGRATNIKALQEAKVATYQSDLLPGTFGKAANNFRSNYPPLRIILPFVPTPVNLFRNGVKLTPGLNLAQQEYRQMLSGALGPEQQAQAIGQMSLGTLFMGTSATLAYEGRITGAGPSDPKAKTELLNAGWKPYSFVSKNADGTTTYAPFSRFDPVAMPLGMMADIMSVATHPDQIVAKNAKPMVEAMLTGMLKSLTDKLYLQNLNHIIQSIDDPDANLWKTGGQIAGEYVPYSSALKAANPDPYMRDARDWIDRALMGLPGFSQDIPAKYDAFGDPVSVHKGLWQNDKGSIVDHEVTRMATEQDLSLGTMPPQGRGGTDLRQIKMVDGSDAYEKMQQLSAQPAPGVPRMKDAIANLINSDSYQNTLVDGPGTTKGTRLAAILDVVGKYRNAAQRIVSADPNVSKAEHAMQQQIAGAVAQRQANPTPANRTSEALGNLGRSFGVDLHSLVGATGAQSPAPLAPGASTQQQ